MAPRKKKSEVAQDDALRTLIGARVEALCPDHADEEVQTVYDTVVDLHGAHLLANIDHLILSTAVLLDDGEDEDDDSDESEPVAPAVVTSGARRIKL